jgi:hypothetical protein
MVPATPILWYCTNRKATVEIRATHLLYATSPHNTNEQNDGKRFRCPFAQDERGTTQQCDFTCKSNVDLQRHELGAHSDYRPFICTEMGCQSKGFKQKSALTTHVNSIHRGVRYSCMCKGGVGPIERQWEFGDPSALARHIKTAERRGESGHGADVSNSASSSASSKQGVRRVKKRNSRQMNLSAQTQNAAEWERPIEHPPLMTDEEVHNGQQWDVNLHPDYNFDDQMEQQTVYDHCIPVDPELNNMVFAEPEKEAPKMGYIIREGEAAGQEFGWPAATDHALKTRLLFMWHANCQDQVWEEDDEKAYWHRYYHGVADDMFCMECRKGLMG